LYLSRADDYEFMARKESAPDRRAEWEVMVGAYRMLAETALRNAETESQPPQVDPKKDES
jgi:hypothetical protein